MKIYHLDDKDIPEELGGSKIWKLAKRYNSTECFYSGIECYFVIGTKGDFSRYHQAATREHLIPRARSYLLDQEAAANVRICSSLMNNLLGGAPLSIKLEARQEISLMKFDKHYPELSDYEKMSELVNDILDKYRIDNKYPWQIADFKDEKSIEEANNFMKKMNEWEHNIFRKFFLVNSVK